MRMKKKQLAKNYLIFFASGLFAGVTLGISFYFKRRKKMCSNVKRKIETEQNSEPQKYSFVNNFLLKNLLALISSATEKASESRQYKK